MKKYLIAKGFKRAGIAVLALLIMALVALPVLFPGKIEERVKALASEMLGMEVSYTSSRISFFRHFPNLTVSFEQLQIVNNALHKRDTLFTADEASAGINILSLIKDEVEISGLYIDGGVLEIVADSSEAVDSLKGVTTQKESSGGVELSISKIIVSKSDIVYADKESGLEFSLKGVEYKGRASLSGETFSLKSRLKRGFLTVVLGGSEYVNGRAIKAALETDIGIGEQFSVNVKKGRVEIEAVPVLMSGIFATEKQGFNVDFKASTGSVKFRQIFALLPDSMLQWREEIKIGGKGSIGGLVKGVWNDSLGLRPDVTAELAVTDGYLKHENSPVPVEDIEIDASMRMNLANNNRGEIDLKKLSFKLDGKSNGGSLRLSMGESLALNGRLSGGLNLDLLTRAIGSEFYRFGGEFNYEASFDGMYDEKSKRLPVTLLKMEWREGSVSAGQHPSKVEKLNADILISVPDGSYKTASIIVNPLDFVFDQKPFNLKASLTNFNDLVYDVKSRGDLDIENILDMLSVESFPVTGKISADLSLFGNQADAREGKISKLDNSGTLSFDNFRYNSDDFKNPFIIPSALIRFDDDKAWLENASFKSGTTIFKVDGYASNFMGYYFEGGELNGKMYLKSDRVNINDLLPHAEQNGIDSPDKGDYGTVQLPERINLMLDVLVKELDYDSVLVENIEGRLSISERGLELRGGRMEIAGAQFLADADYSPLSKDEAKFSIKAKADSFNIKRAYREIPLFRELFSSASAMEGLISLNYSLNGKLNREMSPLMPSLKGRGEIILDDVKIQGLRVLNAISREMGRDSIDNPQLRSVVIRSSISDNIIKIERTRLRVFGFRPRFEGEASFDGRLNIRFRLGLPPFGIIGIPATITGTMDKPKVNLRRSREGDSIITDTEEPENN